MGETVFGLLICLRFIIGSVGPKLHLMKLCTLDSRGETDGAEGEEGQGGAEYGGGT